MNTKFASEPELLNFNIGTQENMKPYMMLCMLAVLVSSLSAQLVTDPLPYAPIANPLPDTMDQLYRDSINLKFSPIRINQAGYRPQDKKYFYYIGSAQSSFSVIDENGKNVCSGSLRSTEQSTSSQLKIRASNNATLVSGGDTRYEMQSEKFSGTIHEGLIPDDLPPGKYRVVVKSDTSHPFVIDEKVYSWVRDALLKFYGVNRCGDSQSWFHPACHLKDEVTGGWHDCGDHLKEGATMSYTAAVLGLAAAAFFDRDVDVYSANHGITQITDGIPDILYEAKHGADFVLQSYDKAGGNVGKMVTSMGGFGNKECGDDHSWWGRPEFQDKMPNDRGGPPRCARSEPTTDYLGKYCANLAFVSKLIRPYDANYADRCLKAAKAIYEFTTPRMDRTNTPAYNGETNVSDDAAFGCLALLWATEDRKYLEELCYDETIGKLANPEAQYPKLFNGGWFTYYDPVFYHASANTDWASDQAHVLWGFFRLILNDDTVCENLNISKDERLKLIEKTVYNLIANLSSVGLGDQMIQLPENGFWVPPIIKYELPWFTMHTQMEWVWNRYQAGNITEMFYYYDIASKIQNLELPTTPASTDWKAEEVKTILIRMMDYMLGVNPWDISMIYGVGDKNFNHPHHRAANPEGKNVPGAFYQYIPPVGALQGGYKPTPSGPNLYSEHFDDYFHSETGIDGTTNILMAVVGLAKQDTIGPPDGSVRIMYVGCDKAIIDIRQSKYGDAEVKYGKGDATDKTVSSDSSGVMHRITLNGLEEGTAYSFYVIVKDKFGRQSTLKNINEERQKVNFTFTTAQNCPTNADIQNVKVCRVTHDSAEIFWYTPNGEFDSKVVFGEQIPPVTVQDGDISGHPVKFHYVKIGGLKEKTKYYFYVESGESRDDNNGKYYTFTTPVEHVNFDVRAVRYVWEGMPTLGLNIMNQDIKSYDSLELRIYVRGPETYTLKAGTFSRTTDTVVKFEDHVMFRVDIGIKYRSDGYQDKHFKTDLDKYVQSARPVRIDDTYDPETKTWGYYIPLPMGPAVMESGARFRIDVSILARSPFYPYQDAWTSPSLKEITDADWSFGPHRKEDGDPYDYDGVPVMTKESVDSDNFKTPINHYITVYRKGEYVWGYSPSKKELETKKTHFELTTQITSPINNPTADYYLYEGTAKTISAKGYAKVTPVDGMINDIWVNGVRLEDPSSYIKWNSANQNYDFNIPVPVRNGRNQADITLFAGPSSDCEECFGCAVSNHSFYIEAPFIQQYPSQLSLKNDKMQPLGDTVKIDTSVFHIIVTDRNGNKNPKGKDTLYVSVTNPELGDSITVMLVETGDSTNTFQTVKTISVVSLPPSQSGKNQISMTGGDMVWVKYIDPTDSTDSSQAYIISKADFPVARRGWIKDTDGNGSIDLMVVEYSIKVKELPDSLSLAFPVATDIRSIKPSKDEFKLSDSTHLTIEFKPELIAGVTGFRSAAQKQGKSYLTHQGAAKVSTFIVADSAGPVLLDKAVLFERMGKGDGEQIDTLVIQLSESVDRQMMEGENLLLRRNGKDYPLEIKEILRTVQDSLIFTVTVKGNEILAEGDSIWLNPEGNLIDYAANHPHPKNPKVPVVIKAALPQVKNSCYKDTDRDGKVDLIEVEFLKEVRKEDLSFKFTWREHSEKSAGSDLLSYTGESKKIIKIDISDMINDLATSGMMQLKIKHADFPNDSIGINVKDSAAPVIISAEFAPAGDTTDNKLDTLTVVFSEDVKDIKSEKPFKLYNIETGKQYTFTVTPDKNMGSTHKFMVKSIDAAEKSGDKDLIVPGDKDSIWISGSAGVSDESGNIVTTSDNRHAPMKVKQADFTIVVDKGPNPLVINKSFFKDDGHVPFVGKPGIVIRVKAEAKVVTRVKMKGSIEIYDALGNKVFKDSSTVSRDGSSSNIYFLWNGMMNTKSSGKYVANGTYLAILRVEREDGQRTVSKFNIGVKR